MFTTSIFKSNYLKYSFNLAKTEDIQEYFLLSTETGLTQNFLCISQDSVQNIFSLIVTNIFNPFNSFKVISCVQVSLHKGTCWYIYAYVNTIETFFDSPLSGSPIGESFKCLPVTKAFFSSSVHLLLLWLETLLLQEGNFGACFSTSPLTSSSLYSSPIAILEELMTTLGFMQGFLKAILRLCRRKMASSLEFCFRSSSRNLGAIRAHQSVDPCFAGISVPVLVARHL